MTQHPDLFAALAAPFEPHEVKVRSQTGRQLHYITARTAMNRLDNVLGPENWWDEYVPSENSVLCRLTIRLPDGSTLTKSDAGGYAGHGRLGRRRQERLFRRLQARRRQVRRGPLPLPRRRPDLRPGTDRGRRAAPPAAPAQPQAPGRRRRPPPAAARQRPAQRPAPALGQPGNVPRTGKALFAWTKDQEQRYEVGLLKYLNGWAKLQEFPGRMVDWDAEQVSLAYAEACRKLQSIQRRRIPRPTRKPWPTDPSRWVGPSMADISNHPGPCPVQRPGFSYFESADTTGEGRGLEIP